MPQRIGLSISLTSELASFIRAQVGSGRYGSASEVVRASLRLLIEASKEHPSPTTGSSTEVRHV